MVLEEVGHDAEGAARQARPFVDHREAGSTVRQEIRPKVLAGGGASSPAATIAAKGTPMLRIPITRSGCRRGSAVAAWR
jgi:hypothetical protein